MQQHAIGNNTKTPVMQYNQDTRFLVNDNRNMADINENGNVLGISDNINEKIIEDEIDDELKNMFK